MSILLVEIVPQGIIFGADRNVSWSTTESQGERTVITNLGHMQRPKVLRWPGRKALIGYVGAAEIGGLPADEWLYDFIGRHFHFDSLETLAESLRLEVEAQRRSDEGDLDPDALVIHLAGFELREGVQTPAVWFIRNVYGMDDNGYIDFRKEFMKSEEFWKNFRDVSPQDARSHLEKLAEQFSPFWFHQGFDLGTFNTLEEFLKRAFRALCNAHPGHSMPSTLAEWESQVRMSILTYGAYFQAYHGPSKQLVGGGADVVSIPWPETS